MVDVVMECFDSGDGFQTPSVVLPPGEAPDIGDNSLDPQWVDSRTCLGRVKIPKVRPGTRFEVEEECFTMFGDRFWFEHVHILPEQFNLGIVLATLQREYEIYNGYRETSRQITVISEDGVGGITVTQPNKSPNTIRPKGSVIVPVSISPEGPPTIRALVEYTFDNGAFLDLDILGQRIVLMSFVPQRRITEKLTWKTEVNASADGTEERIRRFRRPRQRITYRFRDTDEAGIPFAQFSQIWDWGPLVWGLPKWTDYTQTTSAISISDTSFNVLDTTFRDFRADPLGGQFALVWSDKFTAEAVEIDSFTGTSMTLVGTDGFTIAFAAGAYVMPMRTAKIVSLPKRNRFIADGTDLEVEWIVLDSGDVDAVPSPVPWTTYQGRPILESAFTITSGGLSSQMNFGSKIVDLGSARLSTLTHRDRPQVSEAGQTVFTRGREAQILFKSFMAHEAEGRLNTFYMSTKAHDLVFQALSTGDDRWYINPAFYAKHINIRDPYRDLEIEFNDGTTDLRRITVITDEIDASDRELIVVDSVLSQSPANIARISFIVLRRFDFDELQMEHQWGDGELLFPLRIKDVRA